MTKRFESPAKFKCELLPEKDRCVVFLWFFCGLTQKKSYEIIYAPNCAAASLPPKVSLFFNDWRVAEFIRDLKDQFIDQNFTNPAAWKY